MIDFNYQQVFKYFIVTCMLLALMTAIVLSTGCITAAKNTAKEIMKTPTPTPSSVPTPTPSPTPTPIPTPASIPTLAPHFVDPLMHGERWEGQWFKWMRYDVQGEKDLNAGIIVYRHAFVDRLTYFNQLWGQYYPFEPSEGNRYLVIWVHEEVFGTNGTSDPSMWAFDSDDFRLQINGALQVNVMPVLPQYTVLEFDSYYTYSDGVNRGAIIAPPFGYVRRYSGHDPETGGWIAEKPGILRMGKGNGLDGYMIFEVPESTMEDEFLLTGNFATFGSAYWRFA